MSNLTQRIFEADNLIEEAICKLDQAEETLESLCFEIKRSLKFDFAGISLISFERRTIEAVYGFGRAEQWTGRSKHYLEKDAELRDIQADIVQSLRTKVISGWHRRFDRWLYDEFHHDQIIRVYTPLLVVRDKSGEIIRDWLRRYQWKDFSIRTDSEGWCKVYEGLAFPDDLEVIAIGTVEAGYEDRGREITHTTIEQLIELLAERAIDIWKVQLPWVLNMITEEARKIMNGSSATLHFLYNSQTHQYVHQVFSGEIARHLLRDCPPRKEGIGREAIRTKEPQFIPDPKKGHSRLEIKKLNPEAAQVGIKALAAFPLVIDSGVSPPGETIRKEGVLYLAFNQEHEFTENDMSWLHLFASRATTAIRHATMYEQRRDREKLLTTLHSVAQSLADMPNDKDLLRRISWNTLNILGADIVTVYEYIQTENKFLTGNVRAGRFRAEWKILDTINEESAPTKLVGEAQNIYLSRLDQSPTYESSNFARQEQIKSFAGIQLKIAEEIVGVMFINYRRYHEFTDDEKMIIETLASSAALAIKNQRWLTARSEIDQKIITTLDRSDLLNLIADQAAKLTRAERSAIWLVREDQSDEKLSLEAHYPKSPVNSGTPITTSLEQEILGLVARNRKSKLDGNANESVLCVPLLNKDKNLLGVLTVGSGKINGFDEKQQHMLEALSRQAVIGIQNVDNKDRLVQMQGMATLGQLAAFTTHTINNDIGAIRLYANKLRKNPNLNDREYECLNNISTLAEQFLKRGKELKDFLQDGSHPVNLFEVIESACSSIRLRTPQNVSLIPPPKASVEIHVLGNENTLTMVFDTLLGNALDAMPKKGGRISITVETSDSLAIDQGPWIEIRVVDTGKGIANKHVGKIFDLGYTTKLRTISSRMGWGLWLANNYIRSVGGSLAVESKFRQGTSFVLRIPACIHKDMPST